MSASTLPVPSRPEFPQPQPWPDFSIDQRAYEQAHKELGDSATLREILNRAQQIKNEFNSLSTGGFRG